MKNQGKESTAKAPSHPEGTRGIFSLCLGVLVVTAAAAGGCAIPSPANPGVRIASAQIDPPRGWCSAGWFSSGRPWNAPIHIWACKDEAGNLIYESPGMSESAAAAAAGAVLNAAISVPPIP